MTEFVMFYGEAIDKRQQEMGVENVKGVPMKILVNPSNVIAIREAFEGDFELSGSVIYLTSGEDFWVEDDIATVANKLNKKVVKVADEGIAIK